GRVVAAGTESQGIVLDGAGSNANARFGVRLYGTRSSTFDHVTLSEATYGLYQAAAAEHAIRRTTIHTSAYGLYVALGPLAADAITVHSCTTAGVYVTASAGATLTRSVLRNNSGSGLYVEQTGA